MEDTNKKLLQLVYNLRDLQKQYFKETNAQAKRGILIRCKEAERQVDEFLVPYICNNTIITRERRTGERGAQLTAL